MNSIFNDSDAATAELDQFLKIVSGSRLPKRFTAEFVGLVRRYVAAVRGDAFAGADVLEEVTYDRHEAEQLSLDDIKARKPGFEHAQEVLKLWGRGRGWSNDSPFAPGGKEHYSEEFCDATLTSPEVFHDPLNSLTEWVRSAKNVPREMRASILSRLMKQARTVSCSTRAITALAHELRFHEDYYRFMDFSSV